MRRQLRAAKDFAANLDTVVAAAAAELIDFAAAAAVLPAAVESAADFRLTRESARLADWKRPSRLR